MKRGDDVPGEVGAGLRAGWQPKLDDRKGVGLRRIGGKGPFEPRQFDARQGVQGVCQAVQEAAQAGAEGLQRGEPGEICLEQVGRARQTGCAALQAAGPGFFGEAFGEGRVGLLAQPA